MSINSLTIREDPSLVDKRKGGPPSRMLSRVSIIVPVGPADALWRDLFSSIASYPVDCEIWFVAAEPQPADFQKLIARYALDCSVRWITSDVGRGQQMNAGAKLATRDFLWFLHADSQVTGEAIAHLDRSLAAFPGAIHYFELAFSERSPVLTRLNGWGVWVRSHVLGLPFGDQGLCMSRRTFEFLQGFRENTPYGEDHLLIWEAHRERIPLKPVRATLVTSPRAYVTNGWLSTTVQHFWRTWYQAIPQWLALLRSRIR